MKFLLLQSLFAWGTLVFIPPAALAAPPNSHSPLQQNPPDPLDGIVQNPKKETPVAPALSTPEPVYATVSKPKKKPTEEEVPCPRGEVATPPERPPPPLPPKKRGAKVMIRHHPAEGKRLARPVRMTGEGVASENTLTKHLLYMFETMEKIPWESLSSEPLFHVRITGNQGYIPMAVEGKTYFQTETAYWQTGWARFTQFAITGDAALAVSTGGVDIDVVFNGLTGENTDAVALLLNWLKGATSYWERWVFVFDAATGDFSAQHLGPRGKPGDTPEFQVTLFNAIDLLKNFVDRPLDAKMKGFQDVAQDYLQAKCLPPCATFVCVDDAIYGTRQLLFGYYMALKKARYPPLASVATQAKVTHLEKWGPQLQIVGDPVSLPECYIVYIVLPTHAAAMGHFVCQQSEEYAGPSAVKREQRATFKYTDPRVLKRMPEQLKQSPLILGGPWIIVSEKRVINF